ncbi:MAG: hypothetical protein K8R87_01390 [Verrucomicrobia bacterium]|nr:hypothetical protein [Verrucomicrobiota bacterium]
MSTPLTALLVYCLISIYLGENFPFSNFPMYSNPGAERMYYTISAEDGIGLPVQTLTGVTSPKIGKIYRTKAAKYSKKINVKASKFTPAQIATVGQEILSDLREKASYLGRENQLPAKLQLNRTWITYTGGRIVETTTVLAKE